MTKNHAAKRLIKYRVKSGELNEVILAPDPEEAARRALVIQRRQPCAHRFLFPDSPSPYLNPYLPI